MEADFDMSAIKIEWFSENFTRQMSVAAIPGSQSYQHIVFLII